MSPATAGGGAAASAASTAPLDEVAVVAFGYEPAALFADPGSLTTVPDAADATLPDLVDALRTALDGARRVVVIHADWLADDALARMQTARAALDTRRVALVASDLPPLAGDVLCSVAGTIAPRMIHAGRLVGAIPSVAAELVVLAWLRRVSGLKRPPPSMLQHAASAVSRRGFYVQVQPAPFVRQVDPSKPIAPMVSSKQMELVVADREGDPGWVSDVLSPAMGDLPLLEVDPSPEGPAWWGTARLTEVVAVPVDLEALAVRVTTDLRLRECGWCGTRVTSSPCAFCGHAG